MTTLNVASVTHASRHASGGADAVSPASIGAAPALLTINAQTAAYTLVLTDAGKLVEVSNASAVNLTIPLNSSVAFPVGTTITVNATGAGQVTVVATGGVTINSTGGTAAAPKLRVQWSTATLIKRATDTWQVIGDIA